MTQLEYCYNKLQNESVVHSITIENGKVYVTGNINQKGLLHLGIKTMTMTFDATGKCIDTNYGTK